MASQTISKPMNVLPYLLRTSRAPFTEISADNVSPMLSAARLPISNSLS